MTGRLGLVVGATNGTVQHALQLVLAVFVGLLALSCLGALLFSTAVFWISRLGGDAAPRTRRLLARLALAGSGTDLHQGEDRADADAVASGLAALSARDRFFDQIAIVEAAHRALFFVFVMQCTGDRGRLEQVTTADFWPSAVGTVLQRLAAAQKQIEANRARRQTPAADTAGRGAITTLDFHAGPATIRSVRPGDGGMDRVTLRVEYGGRCVATGMIADRFLAAHRRSGLRIEPGPGAPTGLAQIELRGRYDLEFVRSTGVPTEVGGQGRRCHHCGAPYHSDLDVTCANCGETRITPEGEWQLARGWLVVA